MPFELFLLFCFQQPYVKTFLNPRQSLSGVKSTTIGVFGLANNHTQYSYSQTDASNFLKYSAHNHTLTSLAETDQHFLLFLWYNVSVVKLRLYPIIVRNRENQGLCTSH